MGGYRHAQPIVIVDLDLAPVWALALHIYCLKIVPCSLIRLHVECICFDREAHCGRITVVVISSHFLGDRDVGTKSL